VCLTQSTSEYLLNHCFVEVYVVIIRKKIVLELKRCGVSTASSYDYHLKKKSLPWNDNKSENTIRLVLTFHLQSLLAWKALVKSYSDRSIGLKRRFFFI